MHCKLPGHWSRQCPNKKLPSSNNCPPSPTSEDEFGFRIISQSLDINSSFMDADEMYSTSDTNSSNVRFTTGMDRSFRNLEQCSDDSSMDTSISSSGSNKRKRDDPDTSDKINEFPDGFSFQKKKYTLNNDHRTTKGFMLGIISALSIGKGNVRRGLSLGAGKMVLHPMGTQKPGSKRETTSVCRATSLKFRLESRMREHL